jgi:hypothetical protein
MVRYLEQLATVFTQNKSICDRWIQSFYIRSICVGSISVAFISVRSCSTSVETNFIQSIVFAAAERGATRASPAISCGGAEGKREPTAELTIRMQSITLSALIL